MRGRTYLFNAKAHSSNYGLVCHQSSCSKVFFFPYFLHTHLQKILPRVFFFVVRKKKNRFDGLQYKQDANHVQNWFGLVFLAEPCFNSFDLTASLVLRDSIVLSLYKCNTTRMVGRSRTSRAQYTSLQIRKKHNTIQNKHTHTHLIKTPHIPRYLASHLTFTAQYRRHLGFSLVHLREVHLIKKKGGHLSLPLKNRFQCP